MAYEITFSSRGYEVSPTVQLGDVVCRGVSGAYVTATPSALATGARPAAVAIAVADTPGGTIALQYTGEIEASITGLATGPEALARVSATGRIERITTPTATDHIIGRVDPSGHVALLFAAPRITKYASESPATGTWQTGDIVHNIAPSPGGYVGWVCVVAGTPGTWKGFGPIES